MQATISTAKNIFDLLYTKSRTEEILKAKSIKVIRVESVKIKNKKGEFLCCVQSTYHTTRGRCSTFISCWDYLKSFVFDRKLRSRYYIAISDKLSPTIWQVTCPTDLTKQARKIQLYPDKVICNCEDFSNQTNLFKEHPYLVKRLTGKLQLCKHAIATLNTLGIHNAKEYFHHWEPGGQFAS